MTDWAFLAFVIAIPVTMYLFFSGIFGAQANDSGVAVAAVMMATMATYGGLGAAMSAGANIQTERTTGWVRQLLLTALTPTEFMVGRVIAAVLLVAPAIGAVFVTGALRGVSLSPGTWAAAFGLTLAALLPMIVLGLVLGLLFKPQTAGAATTLVMMALSMLGGLWLPLDLMPEFMQAVGRLLPSYWASQLGGWPISGGAFPLQGVVVIGVWTVALAVIGVLSYRRAVRATRR
ncbi:MAG: ABC transporter permease [Micropruina sp.]|nr:MAG: ABC transporter permease [Micropruina sp.]